MTYTIKKLAAFAGVSARALRYYDQVGLLKPRSRRDNGYREYGDEAVLRLQQIMFFRELDFSLDEIARILSQPDFDRLEAMKSHRSLLTLKMERITRLLATVEKTIKTLGGKATMEIKEYYEGFSDGQIQEYREEVRQRWGEKALKDSEDRVLKMGKTEFTRLQAEGGETFRTIAANMEKGHDSEIAQAQIARWHKWLENFSHYSDEMLLGLGRTYSEDPRFAWFFEKYDKDLPAFMTRAIEYYCESRAHS